MPTRRKGPAPTPWAALACRLRPRPRRSRQRPPRWTCEPPFSRPAARPLTLALAERARPLLCSEQLDTPRRIATRPQVLGRKDRQGQAWPAGIRRIRPRAPRVPLALPIPKKPQIAGRVQLEASTATERVVP